MSRVHISVGHTALTVEMRNSCGILGLESITEKESLGDVAQVER
jgi:hypothetical protein